MSRDVILRYAQAQYPYDPDALGKLRHPEWVMDWPQSGERIRGHENDRAINENYPAFPKHVLLGVAGKDDQWTLSPLSLPVRVWGGGDTWIGEMWLEYPDGQRYFNVGVMELRGGLISRDTWYWAKPFDPPAWRTQLVERMDRLFEPAFISAEGTEADERANRAAAERFVEREAEGDIVGALKEAWAEDVVEDMPQSGERIRGLDRAIAVVESHPDTPSLRSHRVSGVGNLFALQAELDYSGATWFAFEILRFRGGKVVHATEYFGEPFEAPEWRARWVERM